MRRLRILFESKNQSLPVFIPFLSNPHHPMKVSRLAVRVACVFPLIGAISAAYNVSAAPAESSIDAVTVYPDAAWVSRVMDLRVAPGLQTVEMERLSSAIQDVQSPPAPLRTGW